ncbi:putative major facilitator superfamily transporter protein [Naviculisporaceae sp. PSN 640]
MEKEHRIEGGLPSSNPPAHSHSHSSSSSLSLKEKPHLESTQPTQPNSLDPAARTRTASSSSSSSDNSEEDIEEILEELGPGADIILPHPLSRPTTAKSAKSSKSNKTHHTDPTAPQDGDTPHPHPPPGPDGGLQAWLQVLGSTIILVLIWGLINTFGVYQEYYESVLLPSSTSSQISWIGSVQASFLFLVGVISGPLFDAGYFRYLLYAGIFLVVFGQFMTSLCDQYWQVLLAQGFCIGSGMGFLFLPSTAIVSQYFTKRRALAIGICSAGSPVAGIVFPIIFSRLEPKIGFGWTTRVIAFILLGLSVIPLVFMRTRLPASGKKRALFDPTALRDAPLVLFTAGGFFAFLALYVPFFYITVFATSHHISTPDFAPYLVTIMNAGSIIGRLGPNALADKWGSLNVMFVCTVISAVLAFGWMGIRNQAGTIVFALLYGASSGGVVSLCPSVLFTLTKDMRLLGTRMGMNFLALGFSIMVGTPIAGAILGGYSEAEWLGMMGYSAAALVVAIGLFIGARLAAYKNDKSLKC